MRFPSVIPDTTETVSEAAIRAVVEHTGVDKTEARAIDMISPITVYAPHGDKIVTKLVVLYATEPPPPGALEDADMEDDESPYDWYTYPNAINRLDERSVAALRSLASVLYTKLLLLVCYRPSWEESLVKNCLLLYRLLKV